MEAPTRSYLVCATPRSGSTLVCQALKDTGVAGRPEEYFEALEHSGRPRRPEEYFSGVDDPSIRNQLSRRGLADEPPARSPLWSRTAYDRYLDWAMEQGTTPNGVFGAKLMWGYLGDFVSLLRNVPEYRDLPLADLLPAVFPDVTFVRVVRANKVRQAVSLWKAVQTATWRQEGENDPFSAPEDTDVPPYKSFLDEHLPALRFNYNAISHLVAQVLRDEARWDAFFEHVRIKPVLVLYENFAADYEASTLNVLGRLGLEPPDGFKVEPRMKSQSDGLNDDWARRYSELRLGTEFDLVPSVPELVSAGPQSARAPSS
jgi:trehalose 2-sulfotransferase